MFEETYKGHDIYGSTNGVTVNYDGDERFFETTDEALIFIDSMDL